MKLNTIVRAAGALTAALALSGLGVAVAHAAPARPKPKPKWSKAKAFDVSPPARQIPRGAGLLKGPTLDPDGVTEVRREPGRPAEDKPHAGDGALDAGLSPAAPASLAGPIASFEGLSNQDNFAIFGGRVNPPDPVGDVGPNHYVQMVNLAVSVYDKQGTLLNGPYAIGALFEGFAVEDCSGNAGDPIVLYDQTEDRWILSQFTSAGPEYWNCVAISKTGDPTGEYYRYAFTAGPYFPDYPKYGVWSHSYIMTTRDFGPINEYGISVYALEKRKMLDGNPDARAVQFFLDSAVVPLELMGDGLLPPDLDGTRRPQDHVPAPIVGTMDDGAGYGATFDALNIFDLVVKWNATPEASLELGAQLPVASFDSIFPCGPSRGCIPQPGITNTDQWVDVLSYRQRPTYRLAYRNFGTYEALVTNQSVEARPGLAGVRWYEIRRTENKKAFTYTLNQQGTYAPNDGVNRWMGSAAMDRQGNIAVGYSVSNGVNVYPGIRYTGRLAGDPLGTLPLGEGTIVNGTGVQRTLNSRWGDYTSLNLDPKDDCTFWYVNEYYTAAGQASSTAGWNTRIGSFKLPGCEAAQ